MSTVREIGTDALQEIGVLGEDEAMSASQGALMLRRFQHQVDAWQADRLTLALQTRTLATVLAGTSTITLGPVGATVTMDRPVWITGVSYLIPGNVPAAEVFLTTLDQAGYAAETLKALPSALPSQYFYQAGLGTLGSLFLWPQVDQDVTIAIYTLNGIGVPATLDTVITGPPGYQDALMYQLAIRLMTPFGVKAQDCPLLVGPDGLAAKTFATIKRVNVEPLIMGLDPALLGRGGGYDVYTDQG